MTWSLNVDGFQSAVEYSPLTKKVKGLVVTKNGDPLPDGYRPAGTRGTVRASHLLVRARVAADLDKLRAYDPTSLFSEDLSADYQFRLVIRREAVAQYQYDTTMNIDYDSHAKEEMNKRSPMARGRMSAYYAVWTALSKMQPNPPYGLGQKTAADGDWWVGAKSRKSLNVTRCPVSPPRWEVDLEHGLASRATMAGQVVEIMDDLMLDEDVENVVDKLQESFGTVDLDTIDFTQVCAAIRGQ